MENKFWETKTLSEMNETEWEQLCDGCGRCCLHKLEDIDSKELFYTRVACKLLDLKSCRCMDYPNRQQKVSDCLTFTPNTNAYNWLPKSCAYRILHEGRPLEAWHPLVSGDPNAVHKAGISVRGKAITEDRIQLDDIEEYIIKWVAF